MKPAISIILPVYNGLPYLRESVGAVLSQTLQNFEFLILDDCSTDGSWEYLNTIKDVRVILMRNETNKGLFHNLNFLVGRSSAPLVKLWSQDDIMAQAALEKIVAFHIEHPSIGFSYTAVKYIDKHSQQTRDAKFDTTPVIIDQETHAKICFFTGSIAGNIANVTITKEAFEKVGLFDERMIISGDFDMWVRISEHFDIGFLKEPVISLRDHDGQLSRQGKYYIKHIEEDTRVFNRLFSYSSPQLVKYGKKELRKHKLVFYYTLMLHAFVKGKLAEGAGYWKAISKMDSPVLLTYYFIRKKMLGSSVSK